MSSVCVVVLFDSNRCCYLGPLFSAANSKCFWVLKLQQYEFEISFAKNQQWEINCFLNCSVLLATIGLNNNVIRLRRSTKNKLAN